MPTLLSPLQTAHKKIFYALYISLCGFYHREK